MQINKLDYNEPLLQVYYVKKLSHFTKYEALYLYENILTEIK